ncbi:hypothetical protein BDZ89DRAFT_1065643 [Hymenopellis radicata]|nr:hypothetical protein BDZ89DRAFT_1065643 [Hymenopellis radicata]
MQVVTTKTVVCRGRATEQYTCYCSWAIVIPSSRRLRDSILCIPALFATIDLVFLLIDSCKRRIIRHPASRCAALPVLTLSSSPEDDTEELCLFAFATNVDAEVSLERGKEISL